MNPPTKTISDTKFNGLTIQKISVNETTETLLISLEAGHHFPKHESPKPALLINLEGNISFDMDNEKQILHPFDIFQIPAKVEHAVVALNHSKFLIVR